MYKVYLIDTYEVEPNKVQIGEFEDLEEAKKFVEKMYNHFMAESGDFFDLDIEKDGKLIYSKGRFFGSEKVYDNGEYKIEKLKF